jgi:hypothetical protein
MILGNTITAGSDQPVTFNNFAAVNLLNPAGAGSVKLDATGGTNDVMTLTGTGPGAGNITLTGVTPISFSGVNTFVYNGAATTELITVSPFATSSQQWNVAVTINGGTGTATLTYNNVAVVPEEKITIQPSAQGAGQIIDSNAATGTSIAVVTYTQTNNFVVNGSSTGTDTDNLVIDGTSGSDVFQINLNAAGSATAPVLQLQDATATNTLLTLDKYTGFSTLNVSGLGGSDTYNVSTGQTPLPGRDLNIVEPPPSGKKLTDTNTLNVFYPPPSVSPRPTIVKSTSPQDPTVGLVSLDYGSPLFATYFIQFEGVQVVTISQDSKPAKK